MAVNHGRLVGMQLNCRSINTGLSQLKLLIYYLKPDYVALCETWLNKNSKNLPKFVGYKVEWCHSRGAAVMKSHDF